ncbi:hypothetical protein [Sphingosinicella terrae]|jgi:hypothetical protein|uniref:hypothetical protein n=1 Tax=Sphingosinicella terrae TaxID=2172047 RepID=UPI000E0DCD35|nr:hypothetical protein [Sphingosinicella terrae]
MNELTMTIALASFGLVALSIPVLAALKGWQGWLEIKRIELSSQQRREPPSPAMERIEIADLKERVRKLESIAACIDP